MKPDDDLFDTYGPNTLWLRSRDEEFAWLLTSYNSSVSGEKEAAVRRTILAPDVRGDNNKPINEEGEKKISGMDMTLDNLPKFLKAHAMRELTMYGKHTRVLARLFQFDGDQILQLELDF